jgi:hypothetical protein
MSEEHRGNAVHPEAIVSLSDIKHGGNGMMQADNSPHQPIIVTAFIRERVSTLEKRIIKRDWPAM